MITKIGHLEMDKDLVMAIFNLDKDKEIIQALLGTLAMEEDDEEWKDVYNDYTQKHFI